MIELDGDDLIESAEHDGKWANKNCEEITIDGSIIIFLDTLSKASENKAVSVFPAKVEIDASNRLKRRISMSGPVTSSPIAAKMVRTRSQIRLVEGLTNALRTAKFNSSKTIIYISCKHAFILDDDKVRIENENVQMMSRQRRIFVGQSANSPKFVVTNNRFPKDGNHLLFSLFIPLTCSWFYSYLF